MTLIIQVIIFLLERSCYARKCDLTKTVTGLSAALVLSGRIGVEKTRDFGDYTNLNK